MKIVEADETFPMPIVTLTNFHITLEVRTDFQWTCKANGLMSGYYFRFNEDSTRSDTVDKVYRTAANALEDLHRALGEYFEHIRQDKAEGSTE